MTRIATMLRTLGLLLALLLPGVHAAASDSRQGTLPAGWKELPWEGTIIRYDPKTYVITALKPAYTAARAAATLVESPDPCPPEGADCGPHFTRVHVFAAGGLDARSWLARNAAVFRWSRPEDFTDTVVGGRQAMRLYMPTDGIGYDTLALVVPAGANILVIDGPWLERGGELHLVTINERPGVVLRLAPMVAPRLAVGQPAMTKLAEMWKLWTAATGGARVYERPLLYGGTPLTILAMQANAVQVRTSDDVTGWIHAPATRALTNAARMAGPRAAFSTARAVQVTLRNGIPMRTAPQSTATPLVGQLKPGQELRLLGVRGDWARVLLVSSWQTGWVRWHYDGARYVEVVRDA